MSSQEPCESSCICEGAVSRVDSSFSRIRSRKRQEGRATGHSLQHTVVTWTSMVLAAGLNMQLGALREQPQLRRSSFVKKRKLKRPWQHLQAKKERARANGAKQCARQWGCANLLPRQHPHPAAACPHPGLYGKTRWSATRPSPLVEVRQALPQRANALCKT